jgi:hypothetical protein
MVRSPGIASIPEASTRWEDVALGVVASSAGGALGCREGGGAENGRYANRKTALMFPIVHRTVSMHS